MSDSFVAGLISGICQTIIGHPFDTLKVYYQNKFTKKIEFKNLYRGLSYPLFTNGIVCSINFGVFSYCKQNYQLSNFTAGAVSGIANGIIITPIELFKIRKQLFVNEKTLPFKGLTSCLLREVPAFSVYFPVYYYLKDKNYSIINSGGIAGTLTWIISYPFDVIKTRVQSNKAKNILIACKQGNLFSGITICLIRSYPVNAIGFLSYEYTLNKILNSK